MDGVELEHGANVVADMLCLEGRDRGFADFGIVGIEGLDVKIIGATCYQSEGVASIFVLWTYLCTIVSNKT